MKKQIRLFLSVPTDHGTNWSGSKEYRPKVGRATFLEPGNIEDDKSLNGPNYQYRYPWWNKATEVVDYTGDVLPEIIYITVFCSGYYQGKYGGSSWYANKAYLSKEAAEQGKSLDSKWERWWVMEAHRRRPTEGE